jgi:FkbM family methyltransferase
MVSPVSDVHTTIVDIGARYGLHPSWKNYRSPAVYHLVEADPEECGRLKKRYEKFTNVHVHNIAILDRTGTTKLLILSNPAMSGTSLRRDISPLYWKERGSQTNIVQEREIECIDLNSFRSSIGSRIDFLKLDTEGTEFDVLKNYAHLDELLGVRSEVCFDRLFDGVRLDTFSSIHSLMLDAGFVLLNMDYNGKGDYFSRMISSNGRYGILLSSDAVWIKKPLSVLDTEDAVKILKMVLFLFRNHAPDLALWMLEKGRESIVSAEESSLKEYAKYCTVTHFYTIKWEPSQNVQEHKAFFESVFQDEYPEMNKFNESLTYNPVEDIV